MPHFLRYQGIAVDYYGFTLDALLDLNFRSIEVQLKCSAVNIAFNPVFNI